MKRTVVVALILLAALAGAPPSTGAVPAQVAGGGGDPWTVLASLPASRTPGAAREIRPDSFQALSLDQPALEAQLASVPDEAAPGAGVGGGQVVSIPGPTGTAQRFRVVEVATMEPGLAAQFPDIHTYRGQGIDDPGATVAFDVSPLGFHASVRSAGGGWYVDPAYHLDTSAYLSYYRSALANPHAFEERVLGEQSLGRTPTEGPAQSSGTKLRIHRAAFAASGEYTAYFGGTVPAAQASIVTAVNRLNQMYETEVAIRMVLVANNASLIYTNAGTDPYVNSCSDSDANQAVVDAAIGSANYDVGHVFTIGSGGCAYLNVVGVDGWKARGTTGTNPPVNDPFIVDYVAHEVGHQYGGNHTFAGIRGSCQGNANSGTAYEVGSGTSIMAYAGICGLDDTQKVVSATVGGSDPFFHSASFDEILTWTTGGQPADIGAQNTGNAVPTAAAGTDGTIPARTPFLLRGSGTDANGDALTFEWQQRDLGGLRALDNPNVASGALFREFAPTTSPVRYLPNLSSVVAGTTNIPSGCPALTASLGVSQTCWSEYLPTASRAMNFRFTTRDNKAGGGGVNNDDLVVSVSDTGAPFAVTSQATAVSYPGNSTQTVTWNVAGTSAAPINAAAVDVLLSTDGGATFPTTLLSGTPNDGTQDVTIPATSTTNARIMVVQSGAGNGVRFFNVNKAAITITAPLPVAKPGINGVTEGNSGTVTVDVPITLSAPSATPVTLSYQTVNTGGAGVATSPDDYDATSGTVTFAPGETSQHVTVTVRGDDMREPPVLYGEWIVVAFSNPVGASLDTSFFGVGVGLIFDDDPIPSIKPGVGIVEEGDRGDVLVDVPVTLSNPTAETVTVQYTTFDSAQAGVASSSSDYVATSGTVTFLPGETRQYVRITVHRDTVPEVPLLYGEWVLLAFSNPSASATLDTSFFGLGILIILDDD